MMDDVLISNLPPTVLRSALRILISQGSPTQKPFVAHVRKRLQESPPQFPAAKDMFPLQDEHGPVSSVCTDYLALTRCLFSSKLAKESLPYLGYFLTSIVQAKPRWAEADELRLVLNKFNGDVVQAVQALKETQPDRTSELLEQLRALSSAFRGCDSYCRGAKPLPLEYPFARAERQVKDALRLLYPGSADDTQAERGTSATLSILELAPGHKKLETFQLAHFCMPRLFNGLWQLSSPAWGAASSSDVDKALLRLVESGLVATDMADHYGDAELVYGDFRNRLQPALQAKVYAASKWCVFGPLVGPVTTEMVLDAVRERCRRLGGRVELLQFHWYDYSNLDYLDILVELVGITKTHPELVSTIGLCNFDSEHVVEACKYVFKRTGALGIVSNQVQFSLVDARPLREMIGVCQQYNVKLLTYGTLCGGMIAEKWLSQPAPERYSESSNLTPSQRKYLDMIETWGSWNEFQSLLTTLQMVARSHDVTLTSIATRWVLQQPLVGAVIVGTRLGVSSHVEDNLQTFHYEISQDEIRHINEVALGNRQEKMQAVFDKLGDCGNEYRAMH